MPDRNLTPEEAEEEQRLIDSGQDMLMDLKVEHDEIVEQATPKGTPQTPDGKIHKDAVRPELKLVETKLLCHFCKYTWVAKVGESRYDPVPPCPCCGSKTILRPANPDKE